MTDLDCRTEVRDDTAFVGVFGEIDMATAPRLEGVIARLREEGATRVVVDLRQVAFMDSAGLHLVIRESKQAGERGFAIVAPEDGPVRELLELTRTAPHLPTEPAVNAPQWPPSR